MFHRPKSEDQDQTAAAPAVVQAAQAQPAAPAQPRPVAVQPVSTPEEKRMNTSEPKMPGRPLDIPGQSAGFQPVNPGLPPRAQFGYPGAQPAAPVAVPAAAAPAASAPVSDSRNPNQGRRLVIGQGITLAGEIEACDYLVIEGTVEAALKGASVLDITQTGMFYGTVEIDEATVAGRFEGEITVNGRLTITATGSVTGTISYKELSVESGGMLDGKISPLSAKQGGQKKESKPSKKGFRNDNEGDEGSLPFGNKVAAE